MQDGGIGVSETTGDEIAASGTGDHTVMVTDDTAWKKRHHWWTEVTHGGVGIDHHLSLGDGWTHRTPDANTTGCCNSGPRGQYDGS